MSAAQPQNAPPADAKPPERVSLWQRTGLSGKLLLLTICFVMVSEILILFPSLGNHWENRLRDHLEAAQIAALALEAAPDYMVSQELSMMLLRNAGVSAVAYRRDDQRILALGMEQPPTAAESVDLRAPAPLQAVSHALRALIFGAQAYEGGVLRVVGRASNNERIEIVVAAAPLRVALLEYSARILALSSFISIFTAAAVFFAIDRLMVRPMRRLTANMTAFREKPQDADSIVKPSRRRDEIGVVERELSSLQKKIRADLLTRSKLAALGLAVGKIHHDLSNMLASAQLISDRIGAVEDPTASRLAPQLLASLSRAIALCGRSMRFGREAERTPHYAWFPLRPLVDEVGADVGLGVDEESPSTNGANGGEGGDGNENGERGERQSLTETVCWNNCIEEGFLLHADREQIFRILLNLGGNAARILKRRGGNITVTARRSEGRAEIMVADDGPGLPAEVREWMEKDLHAAPSSRIGLGLVIVRELARLHGGDIFLAPAEQGASFRISLPQREPLPSSKPSPA